MADKYPFAKYAKGKIDNPSTQELQDYGFKWLDGKWVRGDQIWTGGAIEPLPMPETAPVVASEAQKLAPEVIAEKPTGGGLLEATREEVAALFKAVEPTPAPRLTEDEIPEGWAVDELGNMTTADGWMISPEGTYTDPEGKTYTEAQIRQSEQLLDGIANLFPEHDVAELVSWAEEDPETFIKAFQDRGDSVEARALLKRMGVAQEDIDEVIYPERKWYEGIVEKVPEGVWTGLEKAGSWIDHNITVPWSVLMTGSILGVSTILGGKDQDDIEYETKVRALMDERGMLGALYSDEMEELYHNWQAPLWGLKGATEILNPVWFIPIGGAAGLISRMTTKIPVLGKLTLWTARGVQATEKAVAYPIAKPAELIAKKIFTKNVPTNWLTELPEHQAFKAECFKQDAFRKAAQRLAEIPGAKKILEPLVGKSAFVREEIGKEVLMKYHYLEMGRVDKATKMALMRQYGTTAKILHAGEDAMCSPKWVRPKPGFEGASLALGDVVTAPEKYIFRHKYGYDYCKAAQQVTADMREILAKEAVEIIDIPMGEFEEYVHWVCTGKKLPDGTIEMARKGIGGRIGAKQSFQKHRAFEHMLDGIKAGYKYSNNLEDYVGSYIDGAWKLVADNRLKLGVDDIVARMVDVRDVLPTEPLARLWRVYPEQAAAWRLRPITARLGMPATVRERMADVGYALSAVKRASRGEVLPGAVRAALARRSPQLAAQLEEAMAIRVGNLDRILAAFGKDVWDALKTTPSEFKARLLAVRKGAGLTKYKTAPIRVSEINAALRGMAVDERMKFNLIKRIWRDGYAAEKAEWSKAFKSLIAETERQMKSLKPDWWAAKEARKVAMERVSKPILGRTEATVQHPAFSGRVYPADIAEKLNATIADDTAKWGMRKVADVSGVLRSFKASLDLSAGRIQGLWTAFHHPIVYGKAEAQSWKAFANPESYQRWIAEPKNIQAIQQARAYGVYFGGFEYFESVAGMVKFFDRWAFTKPISWSLRQTIGRGEAAFGMWGDVARKEMWEAFGPRYIAQGKSFEYARVINRMTGVMSTAELGLGASQRAVEQAFVFFAPRYKRAGFAFMADIFKGGLTGSEARKALGKFLTGGTALYYGACQALGQPAYLTPYFPEAWQDSEFAEWAHEHGIELETAGKKYLSMNIGGRWIGIGGFAYGFLRLMADITELIVEEAKDPDKIYFTADRIRNRWNNPFLKYLYTGSAPLLNVLAEIVIPTFRRATAEEGWDASAITAADYLGYPVETAEEYAAYAGELFTPIAFSDTFWDKSGTPQTPLGFLGEILGFRGSPQTRWESFHVPVQEILNTEGIPDMSEEQRQKAATGDLAWEDLNRWQKEDFLIRHPELNELYEEAAVDSATRGSTNERSLERAILNLRETLKEDEANIWKMVQSGEITTYEAGEKLSEAKDRYGGGWDVLRDDPRFAKIFESWDDAQAEKLEDAELFDICYYEYKQLWADLPKDKYGVDPDWDKVEDLENEMFAKYPDSFRDKVYFCLEQNKNEEGEWAIRRWKDTKALEAYWDLPKKPVYQLDEEDVPSEYKALWTQYQALQTDAERDAFFEEHPEMKKDWRGEWRLANSEGDARLALWGFGGKLQTQEAYNLAKKWAEELGCPSKQIGGQAGFPPQHLLANYFEYNQLVAEFGGNSAEARLYKLDHPEWFRWGQEQHDWYEVEDHRESLKISVKWRDLDEQYSKPQGRTEERRRVFRESLLAANPEYARDRRRRDAYDMKLQESLVETYVDWYIDYSQKPEGLEGDWYEDDWFLMENMDFYNAMVAAGAWQEKDFSKVPTRPVFELYKTYQGLPRGKARDDFRAQHLDLDAWLVLKFGYKPIGSRGDKKAKKTPWEEAQEALRLKEWIERQ